jgi:cyclophilin family peptidyl-prolyl cis-trans isomerase
MNRSDEGGSIKNSDFNRPAFDSDLHRVKPTSVQGGGFDAQMNQKVGAPIQREERPEREHRRHGAHERPNSTTTQFSSTPDNGSLHFGAGRLAALPVFSKVVSRMDVVEDQR